MAQRVFVWAAHPRAGSLSEGLADAYAAGAQEAGAEVRVLKLSDMAFDTSGFAGYGHANAPLEPDLQRWQEAITWCDHMLWVHPYWWGAMPAQAKAVLDRALVPGFGFKYRAQGLMWDKLLSGRSVVQWGPVKTASPQKVAGWLDKARAMGAAAARRSA